MVYNKLIKIYLAFALLLAPLIVFAENVDPNNDGSQYAYGENIGWLNFEPGGDGGSGAEVTDTEVIGYVWGENIGWVNLSPSYGGVINDGKGNLAGYAWGENVGWINFAPSGGGVSIDSEGVFSGYAWGENIGWVNFSPQGKGVKTSWKEAPAYNIFYGFFSPVDNPPTVNIVRAGQSVPVKWRITDANGTPITDPASFTSFSSHRINCNDLSGDPASTVAEYAAGSSGLQNLGDGYWQFNWKTPNTYTGQCRTMVLSLGDGSMHNASFKFK